MKKQERKIFARAFLITLTVLSCLIIGIYGIKTAYENTTFIAFGEQRKAFGISTEGFNILDFYFEF